jgi:hypothetical protein
MLGSKGIRSRKPIGVVALVAALAMVASLAPASAFASSGPPYIECTFANGAQYPISDATLKNLGVPESAWGTAITTLSQWVQHIPSSWNMKCTPESGVASDFKKGSRKFKETIKRSVKALFVSPSLLTDEPAYIQCQMNTLDPQSNTSWPISDATLKNLGVPEKAWSTVIGTLGQWVTHIPPAWGISCTEVTPIYAIPPV